MANRNAIVGLFVIAGLVLFTVGMYLVGDRNQAFAKHVDYYVEFGDLAGLTQGAKVRVGGLDAGEVVDIGTPEPPKLLFRVKLQIDEKVSALVRADSVATIGTEGIVGETFMLIRPGTARALPAPERATLPSKEPIDFLDLLDRGSGFLNDADGTLKQLSATVDTVTTKVNGALDLATTTVSNVNDVVVGLKQGRGTAGALLRDEAMAASIRHSIGNAQQATLYLSHGANQADAMISDLQSRHLPQKADDVMTSVKGAASNLDESSKQLGQFVARVTLPDVDGVDPATNIRELLSNANTATTNLVDDTEALKHNFLVRGFFRKRGYYSLNDMPPEKYRTDKVFISPANHRAWLSATELFRTRPDGVEELSPQGKVSLSTAVAEMGESAVDGPIVIEGYWQAGGKVNQFLRARARATLVSQYLQNHLQIEQSSVGIVSLLSTPPPGVGHSTWDGVCIVSLNHR